MWVVESSHLSSASQQTSKNINKRRRRRNLIGICLNQNILINNIIAVFLLKFWFLSPFYTFFSLFKKISKKVPRCAVGRKRIQRSMWKHKKLLPCVTESFNSSREKKPEFLITWKDECEIWVEMHLLCFLATFPEIISTPLKTSPDWGFYFSINSKWSPVV